MDGIFGLSAFFDSAGPMAKSPKDLIPLIETMTKREQVLGDQPDFSNLKIGFADPKVWSLSESMCRQHEGTAEDMVGVSYPLNGPTLTLRCRKLRTVRWWKSSEEVAVGSYSRPTFQTPPSFPPSTVKTPLAQSPVSFVSTVSPLVDQLWCAVWEFKHYSLPEFLAYQAETGVKSLLDVIEFNEKHKDLALPPREFRVHSFGDSLTLYPSARQPR